MEKDENGSPDLKNVYCSVLLLPVELETLHSPRKYLSKPFRFTSNSSTLRLLCNFLNCISNIKLSMSLNQNVFLQMYYQKCNLYTQVQYNNQFYFSKLLSLVSYQSLYKAIRLPYWSLKIDLSLICNFEALYMKTVKKTFYFRMQIPSIQSSPSISISPLPLSTPCTAICNVYPAHYNLIWTIQMKE